VWPHHHDKQKSRSDVKQFVDFFLQLKRIT
jgi:hypothetical protein